MVHSSYCESSQSGFGENMVQASVATFKLGLVSRQKTWDILIHCYTIIRCYYSISKNGPSEKRDSSFSPGDK